MKTIFSVIAISLLFSSCYEQELNKPDPRRKKKRVDSTEISTPLRDTIKTVQHDTVVTEKVLPAYVCKHPQIVSKILSTKRTKIFEKEGRDVSYYSNDFLDIFEVDKTNPEILKYYDKQIDSLIEKLATKGTLNFDAISKDSGTIIR